MKIKNLLFLIPVMYMSTNTAMSHRIMKELVDGTSTFSQMIKNNEKYKSLPGISEIDFSQEANFTNEEKKELMIYMAPEHPNFPVGMDAEDYNAKVIIAMATKYPVQ